MNDYLERVAQAIWQMYAADVARALPAGEADRLAHAAINALKLTEEQNASPHFVGWSRLIGPWVDENGKPWAEGAVE